MRRVLVVVLVVALVAAISVAPANAAKKKGKGTVTEGWQVTAAPYPGADDHSDPATECGTAGVHHEVHVFTTPGRGVLDVAITDYQGEWDLYVTDSEGNLLGASVQFMTGTEERLRLNLGARTEVHVYACNFLGGPTAHGSLEYVYVR